jgi:hypothetical protein
MAPKRGRTEKRADNPRREVSVSVPRKVRRSREVSVERVPEVDPPKASDVPIPGGAAVDDPQGMRPAENEKSAMGLILRSLRDLSEAQDNIIAGQEQMQESQLQLSDRMTTMSRRQEVNQAAAGTEFSGPAGKTAGAFIRDVQHHLLEIHATHSRNEVLKTVDSAMSKLSEFLKVVKRADSADKGWFIAAKFVQVGSSSDKFEDRWKEAERLNDSALASWKLAKSKSGGFRNSNTNQEYVSQGVVSNSGGNNWQASQGNNQTYSNNSVNEPQRGDQNRNNYSARPPRDMSNVRCYFCSVLGHFAHSCPLKQNLLKAQQAQVNAPSLPITQNGGNIPQ